MICLIVGMGPLTSSAHLKKRTVSYSVQFAKGPQWEAEKPFKKQKNIGDHIFFLKDLYHQKFVLLAGSYKDQSETVLILQGLSLDDAKSKLNQSPAIKNGVLKYSIREIMVTMVGEPQDHKH